MDDGTRSFQEPRMTAGFPENREYPGDVHGRAITPGAQETDLEKR